MTGTVDVGVVPLIRLILDMRRRDGNSSFPLLRGFIDSTVFKKFSVSFFCLSFCDGGCERRLFAALVGVLQIFPRSRQYTLPWSTCPIVPETVSQTHFTTLHRPYRCSREVCSAGMPLPFLERHLDPEQKLSVRGSLILVVEERPEQSSKMAQLHALWKTLQQTELTELRE